MTDQLPHDDSITDAAISTPSGERLAPVEPAYRQVIRTRLGMTWLPLVIAAAVVDNVLPMDFVLRGALTVAIVLMAVLSVVIVPTRKYRRLGYSLVDETLRVARGFLFHVDTVVPYARVQHIDVARGPIDRIFGVATLIVHTAGTHNSIVTLPGLAPRTAERIRDDIRAAIGAEPQ